MSFSSRAVLARSVLLAFSLLGVAVCRMWGSAFSIEQLGARASGMGTAFVAVADDGSAIFYNPAGIAFIPGTQMEMDALGLMGSFHAFPSSVPAGTVVPDGGYSGLVKPAIIPVANLYYTRELRHGLTFGFGSFAPFGLASDFTSFTDSEPPQDKYPGRFAGSRGGLQSIWLQPTMAYRLSPNLSIAAGVAFIHTHLEIEESFLNPLTDGLTAAKSLAPTIFPGVPLQQAEAVIARLLPEGRFRVAGTSNDPGFNFGVLYKRPRSKTTFGASWRSAVVHHLTGRASFAFTQPYTLEPLLGASFFPNAFPSQAIKGSFPTPATYSVGASNRAFWRSLLSIEFRFQDYQRFKEVPLDFSVNSQTNSAVAIPPEKDLVFNFRNEYQLGLGFEKSLNAKTVLRTGYIYDRNPVPDASVGPFFPDSNRHTFTFGATRTVRNKEFTVFYEAMKFDPRTVNVAANADQWTNGTYKSFANLFGFGMSFGGKK